MYVTRVFNLTCELYSIFFLLFFLQKCEKLKKALMESDWVDEAKEEALEVLVPELMSSEESATEADGTGVLIVKKLPWRRKKYYVK